MRARFAFPMQVTGRDIAAAPESMPRADKRRRRGPARAGARERAGRPRAERWACAAPIFPAAPMRPRPTSDVRRRHL